MMNDAKTSSAKTKNSDSRWVAELLNWYTEQTESAPSSDFAERCRKAADYVKEMKALRRSARRIGFEPAPFSQYLDSVAYSAGVTLEPMLTFLGLSTAGDASALDTLSAGLVRLAIGMGLTARQLTAHLRLSALAHAGAPRSLGRRWGGYGDTATLLDLTESEIAEAERQMGGAFLKNGGELEAEVNRFYQAYAQGIH